MTNIVPVPPLRLSSRFPTNADRPSGQWNNVVVEWGETTRTMSSDLHAVAQNVLNNATAANERAAAAQAAQGVATTEANRATAQADAAMGYRNTAGVHATTATTQAGIATTKAGEAAASAAQANSSKIATQQIADNAQTQTTAAVQQATTQAVRAETAAASIEDGPITSLTVNSGVKTGAVTLALSDMGDQATDAQMQSGALVTPLLMSPANVRAAVLANSRIQRVARTSNTQLQAADSGKLIDITSGTFTQTFAAVATLGNGWWCYLQNSGTGDITIPSSDGRNNWIMYPGEVRLFQCDGTTLRSVVVKGFYRVFTTSGTFIKPPGYAAFEGLLWGGGCSGSGGALIVSPGGPCERFFISFADLSESTSVVIGAGGLGITGPAAGNPGGVSSFGDISTCRVVWNTWPRWELAPGSSVQTYDGRPQTSGLNVAGGLAGGSGGLAGGLGTKTLHGGRGGDGRTAAGVDAQNGQAPGGAGGNTETPGTSSGAGARGELRLWGII
ncbi:MAG: hypothetical protein ITG01_05790 [Comamonas sp.]|nr:hypothetical protein [Comamonas sp.]